MTNQETHIGEDPFHIYQLIIGILPGCLFVCRSVKVKIQPAGPVANPSLLCPSSKSSAYMLTVTLTGSQPESIDLLTETFEVGWFPCSVTLCTSQISAYLASVAAIFPAAVPQGTQSSQALWRSKQTAERKKKHLR